MPTRVRFAATALIVIASLALAGCSSAAATPAVVYVTPVPSPTPTPTPDIPNLGRVKFGTHFHATTLEIDRGSMTFARTAKQVCWSAILSAPPKHSTIRMVLVSQGSGGVETGVGSWTQEVSNPGYPMWANCDPLPAQADYRAGSYMLRFLDGVTVLAEGRFILK